MDGFRLEPSVPDPDHGLPTIYLEDIYEDFCTDEDLNRVLSSAAYVLSAYSRNSLPGCSTGDFRLMKDHVVMCLINREMNTELLKEIPHREILDLAIIYRIVMREEDIGIMSLIINEQIREQMELTEEELNRIARKNTKRVFPVRILDDEAPPYIMTNDAMINGATTMLYREEMCELSRKIGGDFFILPSSIHEFFAFPSSDADPWSMAAMLAGGNGTVTGWSDVLSNSIYRYSSDDGSLSICATVAEGNRIVETAGCKTECDLI